MNEGFGCRGYQDKVGVLLAQLGTPDAPTPAALRRYLAQFLWDRRVIEVPRLLWWVILHLFILRVRPRRSAALYQRIWSSDGSPLLLTTRAQAEKLQVAISAQAGQVKVVYGMRYGSPSIESALDELIAQGCHRILLLPMYPHYAAATTASTYDAVMAHLLKQRWVPTLRVVEPFYRHRAYVSALAVSINAALASCPPEEAPQKLVLSYHGIPEKYVTKGDPYCCMCTETTAVLRPQLNLASQDVLHTYQSRFGRDPWLVPYTDETLKELAQQGVKRVMMACPGFTADCLETLDELGHEGSRLFQEHGGESCKLIPCLNDRPEWIEALKQIVVSELGSWLTDAQDKERSCAGACPVACAKLREGIA